MIPPFVTQGQLLWAVAAGAAAGFVLGLLGAGGPVVGLPFFLYLATLPPHSALGTNALGVFIVAVALCSVRVRRDGASLVPGLAFAVPGALGVIIGARAGLAYPGESLVVYLGVLFFLIAGWLLYLSRRLKRVPQPAGASGGRLALGRVLKLVPVALGVGVVAGFFGIGGGFMIVPSLSVVAGIDLVQSISVSLFPIAVFAGMVGLTYASAGELNLWLSAAMVPGGLVAGCFGIWLGSRLSKVLMYRVFAGLLVVMGVYIILS